MTEARPFRIIIGGGGISGLTLASSLEKAGIDYVLLEARDTVSPQVGASIGIFPNGGRIIDQLGCFDRVEKEIVPLGTFYNRYDNGAPIWIGDGTELSQKRFNYPTAFLDREILLRVLYENLKDKSKIRVSKRVDRVDHNTKEVIVMCEDGSAFSGDVLIGCDGVYSKVRQELWRVSHAQDSAAQDLAEQNLMLAEYQCLYGISKDTVGVKSGDLHVNYGEGFSTMFIGGLNKVYWFLFQKMDQVYKAPNIPRYSTQDAEDFAAKRQDYTITPDLTFGAIWKNRTSYTLVATEEAQFKQWSWGRIACAGDCVHKMTPNMGAGGNAAIETAAALANELKKMVDTAEKGRPSYETIQKHLGNYQKLREKRVTAILTAANGLTRIHGLKTWTDRLFAFWILPYGGDVFTDLNCDMILGSVKLDFLPVPDRSLHGTMPFNPVQGLGLAESKLMRAAKALPFLAISALAMKFMWGVALPPMKVRTGEIRQHGVDNNFGRPGLVQPHHNFYGLEMVDSRIRGLAACFASFQFVDEIAYWQTFSFLTDAGVLFAILLIEGARRANIMTLASVPLLLGYNAQVFGMGVLLALYCFIHYIQSPIENFRARDMRLTDMSYTASVLPVLILVHYIPNFASFSTYLDPQMRHAWTWIWQPFPIYASVLQYVLKKTVMPDTVQQDRLGNTERDMPTINFTVGSFCALSAATWWYTIYSSPYSLATLFIPNLEAGQSGDAYVRMFLQFDEIFAVGAVLLWLLYLYGDMKNAGMMTDSWISIVLKGAVSLVALGPGATFGLGWLYRERTLATKWHKNALVPGKVE